MEEPKRRWNVRVGIWLVRRRLYLLNRVWGAVYWFCSDNLFKLRWRFQRTVGPVCEKHPTMPLQYGMCFRCKLEQAMKLAALKPRK